MNKSSQLDNNYLSGTAQIIFANLDFIIDLLIRETEGHQVLI